jgi:hypothetical protein
MNASAPCVCYERLPEGSSYLKVGVDETNGRYGDVSVSTCEVCRRRWLFYFAEFEGFKGSQRWIRGVLHIHQKVPFPPHDAIPIFNGMPWFFYQLSGDPMRCGKNDAPADLTHCYPQPATIDFTEEQNNGIEAA